MTRSNLRRLTLPVLALIAHLAVIGATPATGSAQERIVVFSEPGTPVIATEILVVAGPANEPEEKAGLAHLAARSVTEPIRPALDSLGAHLALEVRKDAISFTIISAPDVWEEATRRVMVALFRDPPAGSVVQQQRAEIRAELLGRRANPADAMAREADLAFFGTAHPWGRPAVGTVATVERLGLADVADFLRAYVTSDRAIAVVVGPVDPDGARTHLSEYMLGRGPLPMDAPPAVTARRPVVVDYNSITTWIAASFGFDSDADEEALRLLAHLTLESLTTGPDRHLVYNASAEVLPRSGGGELRFQIVTPPRAADRLGARIAETVAEIATTRVPDDVWARQLRRYRGERLQVLGSPDARANEVARRLLASAGVAWLLPDLDGLTQARLASAHAALAAPSLVFLGPSLD
jgi:predicted Zn-dependent peptidase